MNIRFDIDIAVTATAFFPVAPRTSKHDLARTVVSARFAYTFDETMTAGIALSGLRSLSATTEPTSIGKPW